MKKYSKKSFYIEMTFMELMYHIRDEIEKNPEYEIELSARHYKDHKVIYNPDDRLSVQNCFFNDIFDVPVEITVKKSQKIGMKIKKENE